MILDICTKVKIKSIYLHLMIPNPATTGINHTRTRYYKTRAGSILAIDRPGIQTWMCS